MPKVTFEITPKHRKLMDACPGVNWSEVLRKAVEKEAARQELLRHLEEEGNDPLVKELTALVEEGMRRRWLELEKSRRR